MLANQNLIKQFDLVFEKDKELDICLPNIQQGTRKWISKIWIRACIQVSQDQDTFLLPKINKKVKIYFQIKRVIFLHNAENLFLKLRCYGMEEYRTSRGKANLFDNEKKTTR